MARSFTVKGRIEVEDRATRGLKKAEGSFKRFSNFLKNHFVITLGDVTRAARAAFEALQEAANLRSMTNALKAELAAQGLEFDAYLAKLREVSRGTVSSANLIQSSSKALLLGIPAEQISELLEIARVSSIATGQSVSQAFDDITTGIGRASPMILDNLGLVVKMGPAYEKMAKGVGKSVKELTAAEQKQAILNEVLIVGRERIAKFGGAADASAEALQKSTAALEDFKDKMADLGLKVLPKFVAWLTRSIQGVLILVEGLLQLNFAVTKVQLAIASVIPFAGKLEERFRKSNLETAELIVGVTELNDTLGKLRLNLSDTATSSETMAKATGAAILAQSALAAETQGVASALDDEQGELDETSEAMFGLIDPTEQAVSTFADLQLGLQGTAVELKRVATGIVETKRAMTSLAEQRGIPSQFPTTIGGGTFTRTESAAQIRARLARTGRSATALERQILEEAFGNGRRGADGDRIARDPITGQIIGRA